MNLILATDSYKQSHFKQFPPGAAYVSSYVEARVGSNPDARVLFFGLQAFIRQYLTDPITQSDISRAERVLAAHGEPFNKAGWQRILDEHDGYLPIEIQALPEGTLVKRGTPVIQIRNTDPTMPWLPGHIETALLRATWYGSSVATQSFLVKSIIYDAMVKSSDSLDGLPFKLHDFGARGVSSSESAGLGGMAHLVNFAGTDTLEALAYATEFYDAEAAVGFSLPASEHSTMTSWGPASEVAAYENMLDKFGDGLVSIVSDSYDLFNAVENIFGGTLKDKILNMGGKLVVRPDSGDPIATPLRVIQILWDKFGGTVNSKGFKVLHPKVGVIQGDGMDSAKIGMFINRLLEAGFSMDNIVFGMGGGLLQGHMRDDQRWAMKANAIQFLSPGTWQDVQKKPATDPTKASKAGRQAVVETNGQLQAIREDELGGILDNELLMVWKDGISYRDTTFDEVRARAHQAMLDFHAEVFVRNDEEVPAAAE